MKKSQLKIVSFNILEFKCVALYVNLQKKQHFEKRSSIFRYALRLSMNISFTARFVLMHKDTNLYSIYFWVRVMLIFELSVNWQFQVWFEIDSCLFQFCPVYSFLSNIMIPVFIRPTYL